jgi:hypothetical protein
VLRALLCRSGRAVLQLVQNTRMRFAWRNNPQRRRDGVDGGTYASESLQSACRAREAQTVCTKHMLDESDRRGAQCRR